MGLEDNPSTMERGGQEKEPDENVDTPHGKKIQDFSNEIANVMKTMTDNATYLIERGDKAGKLEDKANELEKEAHRFQKTVQKVERSYWWKNVKIIIVITVIVLIIVLIVILLATEVIPISNPVSAPPTIKPPMKP